MSARRARGIDGELLENAFQHQVIGLLRVYGFELIYHAPENRPAGKGAGKGQVQALAAAEGAGFPDLVAIHRERARLIVAELKTDKGRVAPRQALWLEGFRVIGRAVAEAVMMASDSPAAADADCAPSVEAYLWRPRDWHDLHVIIARGAGEYRRDLDPPEFG